MRRLCELQSGGKLLISDNVKVPRNESNQTGSERIFSSLRLFPISRLLGERREFIELPAKIIYDR